MNQPDWQRALSTQAEVLAQWTGPYGVKMMAAWLSSREESYGRIAAASSAVSMAHLVSDLRTAETLFVTEEMQELVYRAMETFDNNEPMIADELFIPHGFALLEHPFITLDRWDKRTCFRVICWNYQEMRVSKEDPAQREPVLRITLLAHVDDEDDYPLEEPWLSYQRERGLFWGVSHTTALPLKFASDERQMANEGDPHFTWLTFFRVMQRLMAERIVQKHNHNAPRSVWRAAARKGLATKTVRVIELRRERQQVEAKGGDAHYSHRFIVGGHWRQQPYGPRDNPIYRQKYIGEYVKGPEDKPLIFKQRVWLWDR